jgi:hypothetical protein
MGIATHLGPWLLGTVKNTTGTTAGTVRNVGATIVTQSFSVPLSNTTATAFVLPAGALITSAQVITTTLFSAGTIKLSIGATDISNTFTLPTATYGSQALTLGSASSAAATLVANVGTTDAVVTYTTASTPAGGAAVVVVSYIVRNSDGTYVPTAFTGP